MNILIDIRLLARGGTSGIEEYTRHLVEHMTRENTEHQFILFYNSFRKKNLPDAWTKRPNIRILDWGVPNRLLDFSFRILARPHVGKNIPIHAVWSPHFNTICTNRAPRLITFHDLSFLHHPDFFSARHMLWHRLQNFREQARTARRIVAVSEFTKADIVRLLEIPEERIRVVYPGIDAQFKRIPKTDARLLAFKARHDLDAPFILSLGTIEPRKNIPAAIRAFNQLKNSSRFHDLRLVIAGKPGWLYQKTLRERNRSPYRNDIILFGTVPAEERVLLYNLASVFVYPSFFEGFGFPPLEAQASGCPAVISDRTSLPETMGDSALLVDPWRIDALAEALRSAIEDTLTRGRLIEKGLANIRRFSWSDAAQKMIQLLEDAQADS
jgi:glycosyltransferase involved in cell wall biosynthesis